MTGGLDIIQAPSDVAASGFVGALHVRAGVLGHIGLLYGRMQMADLVRTTTSPEPTGGIPYYTHVVGVNWTKRMNGTILGATIGAQRHHLDQSETSGWTIDMGARHTIGEVLRLAAATHLLSSNGTWGMGDVYGAVGLRVWRDTPRQGSERRPAVMELRYGFALLPGYAADHMLGAGLDVNVLGIDFMVAREGGFTEEGWRPVGGIRVDLGMYRLTIARDAGLGDIGSAYRVGLEVGRHD